MAVVIESEAWEPRPLWYLLLAFASFSSIFLFPHFATRGAAKPSGASPPLDSGGPSAPFLRFQRTFLLLFSLSSLTNGLESVLGEYEFLNHGASRSQMALYLSSGAAAALLIGTFLGLFSDVMGPRKFCMVFCILHLINSFLKSVTTNPNGWIMSICLSLASFVLSFGFETWMVSEHEKQNYRQDLLTDTFWLMMYFGSAVLVGSQVLANLLIKDNRKRIFAPSAPAAILSLLSIIYIRKGWSGYQQPRSVMTYLNLFSEHVLYDKRIWLLMVAQACHHFSESIFWILWAPTVVADGREARLPLLYPCFLGSRMLGSTLIPWFSSAASPLFNKDYPAVAFIIAGFCLAVVAYDYQEIEVLMILFCIYNVCAGLILPLLAHLRTMYVPTEVRGGMISLSLAPSSAVILFFLIQGGYYRNISNSTILAFSALGLFAAAGALHALKRWRKQSRHNRHKM